MKKSNKDNDLLKRFMDAAANKDVAALKAIKEEIGRDKWLAQWGGKSVPIEAWIDPKFNPNPFIRFK